MLKKPLKSKQVKQFNENQKAATVKLLDSKATKSNVALKIKTFVNQAQPATAIVEVSKVVKANVKGGGRAQGCC